MPLHWVASPSVKSTSTAIQVAIVGDEAYMLLRQITDFLGLNWSRQYLRVQRNEILASHIRKVAMTAADGSSTKWRVSCSNTCRVGSSA